MYQYFSDRDPFVSNQLILVHLNNFFYEEILHQNIELFDKLTYYFVLLCLGLIVWNICAKKSSSFLLGQALT